MIGYGVNYRSGMAIHSGTHREGMEQPVHIWVPSIATSGLMVYTGDRFPEWRGDLFVGGLRGRQLARLEMDGREVVLEETLVNDVGRISHVVQGPDGYVYLAIDGEEDEELRRSSGWSRSASAESRRRRQGTVYCSAVGSPYEAGWPSDSAACKPARSATSSAATPLVHRYSRSVARRSHSCVAQNVVSTTTEQTPKRKTRLDL